MSIGPLYRGGLFLLTHLAKSVTISLVRTEDSSWHINLP